MLSTTKPLSFRLAMNIISPLQAVFFIAPFKICVSPCITPPPRPRTDSPLVTHDSRQSIEHNRYMLFTGREVRIGKNYARGFEYGARLRPRAVPKTEGTVFPNTDRPRPANNVFIIFFRGILCKQFLC